MKKAFKKAIMYIIAATFSFMVWVFIFLLIMFPWMFK